MPTKQLFSLGHTPHTHKSTCANRKTDSFCLMRILFETVPYLSERRPADCGAGRFGDGLQSSPPLTRWMQLQSDCLRSGRFLRNRPSRSVVGPWSGATEIEWLSSLHFPPPPENSVRTRWEGAFSARWGAATSVAELPSFVLLLECWCLGHWWPCGGDYILYADYTWQHTHTHLRTCIHTHVEPTLGFTIAGMHTDMCKHAHTHIVTKHKQASTNIQTLVMCA